MEYEESWEEMSVFKGIDLQDSFIFSWSLVQDLLKFELLLSIWPESKYYREHSKEDYTCYRAGELIIKNCLEVVGLECIDKVKPTIDPDGSKDYGCIECLTKSKAGFRLQGEFGNVRIVGGNLVFHVCA